MTETLTKEEREALSRCARCVRDAVPRDEIGKALRIIDAHAADRAALVAQLEVSETTWRDCKEANDGMAAIIAELTRERDEARAQLEMLEPDPNEVALRLETTEAKNRSLESEVTRLTEALAASERKDEERVEQVMDEMRLREAAEARVREMSALLMQHGIEHG